MPLSPPKAVLFDLDGTLIDHFTTIHRCYSYAMDTMGLPPQSYATVRAAVGGSIPITFGKLIPKERIEEGVRLFREHYEEIWQEDLHALPGTEWVLAALHARGLKLGILTNKEGHAARAIADLLGWTPFMTTVLGRNDTAFVKPSPEMSAYALEKMGVAGADCWFVGDSPYDIAAARAGHMIGHVLATGSHSAEELEKEGSDGVFADLETWARETLGVIKPAA